MKPSAQQQAVIDAAASTTDNLTVDSVAGSGKTTVLALAAKVLRGTGRATSFSRDTTIELGNRLPSSFPARTMHGEGKDIIERALGRCTIDKSNDKVHSFVMEALKDSDESWQAGTAIKQLVSQAQTAGIVPENDRWLLEDTKENWATLADNFDIEFNPVIHSIARRALLHSNEIALSTQRISFDDMLYLPLFFKMRPIQYKTVIVDEAQDLSPIQHLMVKRMLRPGGRLIAAGDENQAIYGFRGAMTNSYEALAADFGCTQLSLHESFRCPKAVTTEAQRYVPHMVSTPNAPEGAVLCHDSLSLSQVPNTVLCRNNAPLVGLALRLLVAGITAEVAGRDIGQGLISLTKRLASGKNSDNLSSDEFLARLHRWEKKEIAKYPKRKSSIRDKVDTFEALAAHHRTLGQIRNHLKKLYVNPTSRDYRPAQVHLTTIHKAKGREWDQVLFLDPHLLPSKYAVADWEIRQESNLAYVGITRAKQELHYASSECIY